MMARRRWPVDGRARSRGRRTARGDGGSRGRGAALLLGAVTVLGTILAGCLQSVPDTTVPAPIELENSTIDITASTANPGEVVGDFAPTPAHTSVNVDPGYLVFDPTTATLTVPITAANLTAGTAPSDLSLSNVHATLTLEDAQSGGPLDYNMQGTPVTWIFHAGAGSSYDAATSLALTLTLQDPNALRDFVDLLTTGGDNTTKIVFHADSTDLDSATL